MSDNTTTILPDNTENRQVPDLFNNNETVRNQEGWKYTNTKLLYDDFYGKTDLRQKIDTVLENDSNKALGVVDAETYHKETLKLGFSFPDWTYGDWLNERNIWQRGLYTFGGEPNWFYFKVFFKFNTQHGLLGGLLNDTDVMQSTNSAGKYLKLANNTYGNSKLLERLIALKKFASILSRIQTHTPWFFKSVKGLDKASYTGVDLGKEKSIELTTLADSVDLRLTTLFELYKFACFDDINNRELIPENLRKFEMCVLIYSTPISFLHDSLYYNGKQSTFKSVINNGAAENNLDVTATFKNTLSYKMYTFKNCEFSLPEISSLMPNDVNNESPFKIAEGSTLKIIYDKCYVHTSNELMGMMFGSDGFYYNQYKAINEESQISIGKIENEIELNLRFEALKNALYGVLNSRNLNSGQNKLLFTAGNELSNSIYESVEILNNRTSSRALYSDDLLFKFDVPIFKKGFRKLDNFIDGTIRTAITASKNYLTNKLKDKLKDALSSVTRKGSLFGLLNATINDIGRQGNNFESNKFKPTGSIGRKGNKDLNKLSFMEDLKENYEKNKNLFNNVTIDSLERQINSELDTSKELNETIYDNAGYKNRNSNITSKFEPFTREVKNAFNDPSSKHKFNNVTGNIGKQVNDSLILDNTVLDNPTYKHRKADFDKQEYKPFTDTVEENKNATNGITNKNTVRSTTFGKLSATAAALKNA